MYYINKCRKSLWLLLAIGVVVIQTSCEKDQNLGDPVITGLRAISPAPNDTALSHILPGQVVVVQGQNLGEAQQIFFSGYEAGINAALNTNHSMVVTVPSGIVFEDIPEDKLNRVRLVTSHGEANFKISVIPPPPVINSIDKEFANAGVKITLTGNYLYTVEKIVFPDDIEVTEGYTSSPSGENLTVTVPNGVASGKGDSIEVVTAGGASKYTFNNTIGIIANFTDGDPKFGWAWWAGTKANDPSVFPNGWGNYIEIKPANLPISPGDQAWYGGDSRAVVTDGSVPWEGIDLDGKSADYALKFEMNYNGTWTGGTLEIVFDNNFDNMAQYAPWENTATGKFETDGWITITIPLNTFLDEGGTGESLSTVDAVTFGGNTSVQIMLYNNGEEPLASFDAAFDNLRIVKIN